MFEEIAVVEREVIGDTKLLTIIYADGNTRSKYVCGHGYPRVGDCSDCVKVIKEKISGECECGV